MDFTPEFIDFYSSWTITIDDKLGHSDVYTQENTDPKPVYWKMAPKTDKIYVTGTATVKSTGETVTLNETLTKKDSLIAKRATALFWGRRWLAYLLSTGERC